jgi:ADP-ribose pyrophosphatase YjhB (NUDIX family)
MVLDRVPAVVTEDLARLREDYGEFHVHEEVVHSSAEEYDDGAEPPGDGVYRFASAWVRRDGEVLLVRPVTDDGWASPGGRWEPGETFEETARRETREETAVDCRITGVVEARVGVHEFGDRATVPWIGPVFDAEYVGGDPERQPEEVDELRWFGAVPDPADLVFERAAEYPL